MSTNSVKQTFSYNKSCKTNSSQVFNHHLVPLPTRNFLSEFNLSIQGVGNGNTYCNTHVNVTLCHTQFESETSLNIY